MIRLDIMKLLEQRGKTKYWLYKRMGGMNYQKINRIANGETKAIRFEALEGLGQVLECTPNNLFVFDLNEPESLRHGFAVPADEKEPAAASRQPVNTR